jgi:hypothetical protein
MINLNQLIMAKKIRFIILTLICGILLNGCEDENEINTDFKTGLNCKIKYGQGDCMPVVGEPNRKYNDYSGKVFIVRKQDYDRLIDINVNCNCIIDNKIDSLMTKSISINITDGRLIKELQPDSFLIMIDSKYTYYNDNVVYVKNGSIVAKDLYFFHCTSY